MRIMLRLRLWIRITIELQILEQNVKAEFSCVRIEQVMNVFSEWILSGQWTYVKNDKDPFRTSIRWTMNLALELRLSYIGSRDKGVATFLRRTMVVRSKNNSKKSRVLFRRKSSVSSMVPRVTPHRLSVSLARQRSSGFSPWEHKQIETFRYTLFRWRSSGFGPRFVIC